jgi:hypothetical protein
VIVDVAVADPLLFCVTLVELEFDDDALPLCTDALEWPVLLCELVLLADPPMLPVVLPLIVSDP